METYIIEHDYTATFTDYYEVEAKSLDEAIMLVKNGDADMYKSEMHDMDNSCFDDSKRLGD